MKKYSFLMLFYALSAHSEMALLDDEALSDQTGQTGITLSARAEFGTGTRISYNNTDASYVDPTEYWLVVDELTGAIEIKGLKLDLINDFGPTQNKSALQWTMPEEVIFDELKTEGITSVRAEPLVPVISLLWASKWMVSCRCLHRLKLIFSRLTDYENNKNYTVIELSCFRGDSSRRYGPHE